uniref:Phosphatidylethanolamine N-methyltransferase n=1 Tax=Sinocyclocheilus anshuiensis TaxID=1608454 RepID=A0A671Q4G9_9TELE
MTPLRDKQILSPDDANPALDCCGGLNNVDYSQMDMSVLAELWRLIDLSEPRFCVAVIAIIFNPFFWNVVARWEHRTRGLTRLFGGPYVACYALAGLILLLNVYRSHRNASPVGVILTAVVGLSYKVAIAYEGPHLNDQEPCKNYIS